MIGALIFSAILIISMILVFTLIAISSNRTHDRPVVDRVGNAHVNEFNLSLNSPRKSFSGEYSIDWAKPQTYTPDELFKAGRKYKLGYECSEEFEIYKQQALESGAFAVIPPATYDEDMKQAEACFRAAAVQGHALAQYELAELLRLDNDAEALKWYRAAAAQELPEARYELATLLDYLATEDCEVELSTDKRHQYVDEALRLYEYLAVNGHHSSMMRFGSLHARALEIIHDSKGRAISWLERYAGESIIISPDAAIALSRLYGHMPQSEDDLVKSYAWLITLSSSRVSRHNHDVNSLRNDFKAKHNFSDEQIVRAEKEASKLRRPYSST